MWLDREEENSVVFLLFPYYMQKIREWFALLLSLLVEPILAHTCWVCTFSCLSRERTVHYTIVLIPTVFLPYALVSNCYLVTIFFIRIIHKKFEFTSHAHSWSFANIIVVCQLGSVHVIFLSYYYQERTELKLKNYMISSLPQQELARISKLLHSSTFCSRFGTVWLGYNEYFATLIKKCWSMCILFLNHRKYSTAILKWTFSSS